MPVHYDDKFARFTLETANTCYVMQILFDKYPVHLYYGKKDVMAVFRIKIRISLFLRILMSMG